MSSFSVNQINLRDCLLTLPQTSPGFYMSAVHVFWKHCWKKGEAALENFLPFSSNLNLSSANSLNLGRVKNVSFGKGLTLSQMTNLRLFQTLRGLQTIILSFMKMTESSSKGCKTLWEKEKLLVMNNFSFSHRVFKVPLLQTRKNKGLFGRGLK